MAKHLRAVSLLAAMALAACRPSLGPAARPDGLYAEIPTDKGLIVLRLEFEATPMTVANFVGLAEGTIANAAFPPGTPYFDGTAWHRVVAGHVIQCGIPRSDTAKDPGYVFPNEILLPNLNHGRAGMVNMANGGPHTNASQWCITLGDRSYLDGDYTVFGRVVEGLDVVFAIRQGDEVRAVKIARIGEKARAFKPTTESFKVMVDAAWVRVRKADAEKKVREEEIVRTNWPNAVDGGKGLKFIILREGQGPPPEPGARVKVAYSGKAPLSGKTFISTAEDGKPYWGETPEAFDYDVGKTKLHPGLDATIGRMKKGEKRLVIVPAERGYGTSGFYARQRPNEKRFVISPNTLLVYEVEIF